jgi:hypothetical protein
VFEPLVIWDLEDDPDGDVAHIAEHGITQDEVEEVVGTPANPTVLSDSSGRPITFGWTDEEDTSAWCGNTSAMTPAPSNP